MHEVRMQVAPESLQAAHRIKMQSSRLSREGSTLKLRLDPKSHVISPALASPLKWCTRMLT
jgi:hypothetical protein